MSEHYVIELRATAACLKAENADLRAALAASEAREAHLKAESHRRWHGLMEVSLLAEDVSAGQERLINAARLYREAWERYQAHVEDDWRSFALYKEVQRRLAELAQVALAEKSDNSA